MSIRDDLARRLMNVVHPSNRPMRGQYLDMADECLRQMEWARTECAIKETGGEPIPNHFTNQGEPQFTHILREIPNLTLAPDDWRPS